MTAPTPWVTTTMIQAGAAVVSRHLQRDNHELARLVAKQVWLAMFAAWEQK